MKSKQIVPRAAAFLLAALMLFTSPLPALAVEPPENVPVIVDTSEPESSQPESSGMESSGPEPSQPK